MSEVKQESKYWGFYDRFGVTIGLIVDLAAIITFLFHIRTENQNATSDGGISDTAFGIMAVALLYSIGFVNYQIFKRWNALSYEDELNRRLVLALVTNFPFTILYIHLFFSRTEPATFWGSLVLTMLFEILITPVILFMSYGFEILIAGESNLD